MSAALILEVVWSAGREKRGECAGLAGDGTPSSLQGCKHALDGVARLMTNGASLTVGETVFRSGHHPDAKDDRDSDAPGGLPPMVFGRGTNRNFGASRRPTFHGAGW